MNRSRFLAALLIAALTAPLLQAEDAPPVPAPEATEASAGTPAAPEDDTPARFSERVSIETSRLTLAQLLREMMCKADVKIHFDRRNPLFDRSARSVDAINKPLSAIFAQLSSDFPLSIQVAPTGQVQITTWPSEEDEKNAWIRSRIQEVIDQLNYFVGVLDNDSILELASMLELLQRFEMFEQHYISTSSDLEIFRPCVLRSRDDLRREVTYLQSTKTTATELINARNQMLRRLLDYFQEMADGVPEPLVDRFQPTLQAALDTTAKYQDMTVPLVEAKQAALIFCIDNYDLIQRPAGADVITFSDPAVQERWNQLYRNLKDYSGTGGTDDMGGIFELAPPGK